MSARIEVEAVPVDAILGLREAYRAELACQIVHDSWHERGFTTSYLLRVDDSVAGYGSVGGAPRDTKDTLKELYVVPELRRHALPLCRELIAASAARTIEAQTNDPLLLLMLLELATGVTSSTILFADGLTTRLPAGGAVLRPHVEGEPVFEHTREPPGEYVLELDGAVVATGGLASHYNPPYVDLYLEVDAPLRRRGLGSYLVQELKRVAYEAGRIPGARCDASNTASRAALERAGMFPCARILRGTIA